MDNLEHSHEHEHGHGHEHEHIHNTGIALEHSYAQENDADLAVKKKRWAAVDNFKSVKGRNPTDDELQQLLEHGHTHEHLGHPGIFSSRDLQISRNYNERAFTVGIGGPVGSGKTALLLQLCRVFRKSYSIAAVTNDIFTQEDGEFLIRNQALEKERIRAIETGGCPHAAIREDISANLQACEELTAAFKLDLVFVESGGDNLAANYSRELADFIIYVIDVAGGDKVPRKGGPGITQADLLVINKTDLAEKVGADLSVMERDATKMREGGPTVFAEVKSGKGVEEIELQIRNALNLARQ